MRFSYLGIPIFVVLGSFLISSAKADSIVVNASAVIYAAGSQSGAVSGTGGTAPGYIALPAGATSISFSSVTGSSTSGCASSEGCVTLNGGGSLTDPDGLPGATGTSSNNGYGSISGITAPGTGYLVGVFVAPGGPTGTAPTALDYTTTSSTSSSSYTPLLDQTFFVGDGLTGDGSGAEQDFFIPSGATELYLGISDAGGYNGNPGSYGDNFGTFTATYATNATGTSPSSTPEPASLVLLGSGLAGLLFARRLRRA